MVAATPTDTRTFAADEDLTASGGEPLPDKFSVTPGGRWFVYGTQQAGDPVHVLDSYNGNDEALTDTPGQLEANVLMTDDGAVVAHSADGSGWFEHLDDPGPGL